MTEGLPPHEWLWKLEGSVFDEFAIESTVGSIVDVFKEKSVHGGLYGSHSFLGVYLQHM